MSLDTLTSPSSEREIPDLFFRLANGFREHGVTATPDAEFGHLTQEYFGLNLDDSNQGINLGFMQIIFNPDASWQVLVPQSPLGRRSLTTLAEILNRPIDETKIGTWKINYACYTYLFSNQPKQTPS